MLGGGSKVAEEAQGEESAKGEGGGEGELTFGIVEEGRETKTLSWNGFLHPTIITTIINRTM